MDNYENMTFTDKDREQLKKNRDDICNWIKENIIPRMLNDDRIVIDFGKDYLGMRSYETVKTYHFSVFGNENTFFTGGGTRTRGQIAIGFKYSTIECAFDCVDSPYEIFPFIDNWKEIKSKLMDEIKMRETNREMIYSFKV